MDHVIEEAARRLGEGERFALVIITRSDGSTPRKAGSKMLVSPDRSLFATIGGGAPEAAAADAAVEALASGRSRTLGFDFTQSDIGVADPICGGEGSMMICVLEPRHGSVLAALVAGAETGGDMRLLVRVSAGTADIFAADARSGALHAALGTEIGEALRARIAELCDPVHGSGEAPDDEAWYVETVAREGHVYLFGGGHVSQATEEVARVAGFTTVVVDDREEFSNPVRFPSSRCLVMPGYEGLDGLRITPDDYIVIATRGHSFDGVCLRWALTTKAGYIGMIGSSRKVGLMLDGLRSEGVGESDIARVHAPIGLPIGGHAPGEIAVSIVAQLVSERVARYGE